MKKEIPIHTFIQDDETSIPFRVIPLETRTEYDTSVPHRHNYYEIFIFQKGGGTHEIDFIKLPIHDNSIHYVSPGQVHQVNRELDSFGYVILFSRDFYSINLENKDTLFDIPFLNNNTDVPIVNLESKDMPMFIPIIENLIHESKNKQNLNSEILQNYLHILLLMSNRYYKNESRVQQAPSLIKKFKILLEKKFTELHKVKEYATLLNVTEKHLNETVKKYTGLTASDFIFERILLEAKRLIKHSELNYKEISHFLNYEDPAHFSKFFKSKTGLSPSEFRSAEAH